MRFAAKIAMIWALASEARSNQSTTQDKTEIVDAIVAAFFPRINPSSIL